MLRITTVPCDISLAAVGGSVTTLPVISSAGLTPRPTHLRSKIRPPNKVLTRTANAWDWTSVGAYRSSTSSVSPARISPYGEGATETVSGNSEKPNVCISRARLVILTLTADTSPSATLPKSTAGGSKVKSELVSSARRVNGTGRFCPGVVTFIGTSTHPVSGLTCFLHRSAVFSVGVILTLNVAEPPGWQKSMSGMISHDPNRHSGTRKTHLAGTSARFFTMSSSLYTHPMATPLKSMVVRPSRCTGSGPATARSLTTASTSSGAPSLTWTSSWTGPSRRG